MTINIEPRVRTRTHTPLHPEAASLTAVVTAAPQLAELRARFVCTPIDDLKPASRRVRKHGKGDLATLVANIERFRHTPPIRVTDDNEIVDGHLLWEAYRSLGFMSVPTQVISGLSEAEIKTLRIAIHGICQLSQFDDPALSLDIQYLFSVDPLLVTYTALPMPKVDILLNLGSPANQADDAVDVEADVQRVARIGDRFVATDGSVIYNGDAKDPAT